MDYIGISAGFHDASISVISGGDIVFAGHSERYSKIKNDKNLHSRLVEDALSYISDDYELHYYENPTLKYLRQLRAGQKPNLNTLFAKNIIGADIHNMFENRKIHTHGHHLTHAAAGFQTSGFVDATVVVIDAIGEFDTISIWDARYTTKGPKYKKLWSQKYPNSIGLFYSAMTKRVGLKPNEEEYILMGMSAYGNDDAYPDLSMDLLNDSYNVDFKVNLHTGIEDSYLDNFDNFQIASSAQTMVEHLIMNVMQRARVISESRNLVYAGGVALNCVANKHLAKYFDCIWIMPNPGDSGSSLGAAALGFNYRVNWKNAFLGYNITGKYPVNKVLDSLLKGEIVGVASGRAEFGPRALGNRSLLADPRGNEIKEKVNEIKRRQKFRPFAPVILEEYANQYFSMPRGFNNSRYMQSVATCRHPELFPAIVHVDGTSRVQTVPKDGTGIRELLEKWYIMTECPMLLNTSLNIRGEPMVNDRGDARRFEKMYGIKVYT
jgi:carbamoyltransferase